MTLKMLFVGMQRYYKDFDRSPLENVYKAMRSKDLSECVVTALNDLRKDKKLPISYKTIEKSETESFQHLYKGKKCFENGDHDAAIWECNIALMLAPQNSDVMRIVYSFRAELLFALKQYSSCVKDLETSMPIDKLPFDDDHSKKLKKMKMDASNLARIEKNKNKHLQTTFTDEFFEIGKRNPNISCVSANIEVKKESEQLKVVAARDIPTGTVVALEPVFVTAVSMSNRLTSCYYCNKMTFSLVPCDGCCYVMFCDEQCKTQSMQEGHNIECKIMGLLIIEDSSILALKAVLKMRQRCQSWNELILASQELGVDRMKNSSVADIFSSDKFSLLYSSKDPHFIYGAMFKNCVFFANIIYYLDIKTSFLPGAPEDKSAAIRAISRIMMHLSLYVTPVAISQGFRILNEDIIKLHNHINTGYFPFISNLSHSCVPNTYIIGTRRGAGLVTTKPIKQGSEITTSHYCSLMEIDESQLLEIRRNMFIQLRILCSCIFCTGDGNINFTQVLTESQRQIFQRFLLERAFKEDPRQIKSKYMLTCQALKSLQEVPFSKEYREVFQNFIVCILRCVYCKYPNISTLDDRRSTFCAVQFFLVRP